MFSPVLWIYEHQSVYFTFLCLSFWHFSHSPFSLFSSLALSFSSSIYRSAFLFIYLIYVSRTLVPFTTHLVCRLNQFIHISNSELTSLTSFSSWYSVCRSASCMLPGYRTLARHRTAFCEGWNLALENLRFRGGGRIVF